jgi:hypothetical protein
MPKVKIGKIRELHAHLTSILNDCDAERAPAEDDKVGAGEIMNSLSKPAQDSALGRPKSMSDCIPGLHRDTSHCK